MASVTSLDADMRNLRLSRYTPQAANEARIWIQDILGEPLPNADLLDSLKDGVALCKLANLAIQPSKGAIKFKSSAMPFIQMENISHFLKACELSPLSLPAHDRFLTVDLFEQKDPAQVLQCLSAFSRQANKLQPSRFPSTIGPKKVGTTLSPATTGNAELDSQKVGAVSSWSKKSDESSTVPAWNIHQYGYMGGASQGNQGVAFGARRQITSQAPAVPSLAEKEKLRREKEDAAARQQRIEFEHSRTASQKLAEDEERERLAEEQRWETQTNAAREERRKELEFQKKKWEEQERSWTETEAIRREEDAALHASLSKRHAQKPVIAESILDGQTLGEYQRKQALQSRTQREPLNTIETPDQIRVKELEKQLEEARERERQYQADRDRMREGHANEVLGTNEPTAGQAEALAHEQDWQGDEREQLRKEWHNGREDAQMNIPSPLPPRPLPAAPSSSSLLPDESSLKTSTAPIKSSSSQPSRPSPFSRVAETSNILPERSAEPSLNRTDVFLSSHNAPFNSPPRISSAREAGDTSLEQAQLKDQRIASQQKTAAKGWASKSLLEREMERERERQREWEADQQTLKIAPRGDVASSGPAWDVNQYGYLGGDSMNKGSSVGSGIDIGGRRQIVGPRAPPHGS